MKKLIVSVLFLSILMGCSSNEDIFPETGIASDINFMPEEIYENFNDPNPPILKLKFVTAEIFPCINFSIDITKSIEGNQLSLRFNKIEKSPLCFTALGPAITYIELPENIETLVFINRGKIDRYSVETTNEQVVISTIEKNFTNLLHDKTFRYPENTFAYTCGTNTDNVYIYNEFLDLLRQTPSLTEHTFTGDGRIPFRDSSDGHWVDNPSRYFKYTNEVDFNNLKQVLKDYAAQHITPSSGVTISLVSWDNRKHYSWLN